MEIKERQRGKKRKKKEERGKKEKAFEEIKKKRRTGKMEDPCKALPPELFQGILSFLPFKEVFMHCLLVNREWNLITNSGSLLWRSLLFRDVIMPTLPDDFTLRDTSDNNNTLSLNSPTMMEHLIDEEEKKDDGIRLSRIQSGDPSSIIKKKGGGGGEEGKEEESDWKRYFVWKVLSNTVRWKPHAESNRYNMRISADGKVATKTQNESLHCQAWGTRSFTTGFCILFIN